MALDSLSCGMGYGTVSRKRKEKSTMEKITKISRHFSEQLMEEGQVATALLATFRPFGSLTEGIDGNALASAMMAFVGVKKGQPELAKKILELIWSAETDQLSSIEFGSYEVVLRTPTSATKIRLYRYAGGHSIEVDFGAKGSTWRALDILASAEMSWVKFDVYSGEGQVERSVVMDALFDKADAFLEYAKGMKPESYSEEYRSKTLVAAREEFNFFDVIS